MKLYSRSATKELLFWEIESDADCGELIINWGQVNGTTQEKIVNVE